MFSSVVFQLSLLLLLLLPSPFQLSTTWQKHHRRRPSSFLIFADATHANTHKSPPTLNLTTIATRNKESVFECWQLAAPFVQSTAPGTAGAQFVQLGKTNNTSYGFIPPHFDGGLHNGPAVQYVAFTSGKAVITLPNSTDSATIHGGKRGLILVTDIVGASSGHITKYPSDQTTTVLQIPLDKNKIPDHKVLHPGACSRKELSTNTG